MRWTVTSAAASGSAVRGRLQASFAMASPASQSATAPPPSLSVVSPSFIEKVYEDLRGAVGVPKPTNPPHVLQVPSIHVTELVAPLVRTNAPARRRIRMPPVRKTTTSLSCISSENRLMSVALRARTFRLPEGRPHRKATAPQSRVR